MSRRTEKVASTLQFELAKIVMHELSDPRLTRMISITRVHIAEDISTADVYVSIMGTPGQQTAALNALKHSAGLMRTKLTKQLTLRIAPFLKFHIDEELQKELAMLDLLRKVADENAEIDRKRAEAGELPATDVPAGDALATADMPSVESTEAPAPAPSVAGIESEKEEKS